MDKRLGIRLSTWMVGAITWPLEDTVKEADFQIPAPSAGPSFVPANLHSAVGTWLPRVLPPVVTRTLALLNQGFWWVSMEIPGRCPSGFFSECESLSITFFYSV